MEARVKAFLTKVEYMVEGETISDAITRLASEKGGGLGLSWDAGLDDADCDVIAHLLHGGALAQLSDDAKPRGQFYHGRRPYHPLPIAFRRGAAADRTTQSGNWPTIRG